MTYLLLVLLLGLGLGLVVAFVVYRRMSRQPQESSKRSVIDYLLVWPIILGADAGERNGKIFTAREWLGWLVVVLVVVFAILFT